MAAMNSSNKVSDFIDKISYDFPQFKFKAARQAHWSPSSRAISFNFQDSVMKIKCSVLHELAHALLNHSSYTTDFELLKLESEAWTMASKLAPRYGIKISDDYIQSCLDTYRDWLHRRSTCPVCNTHVMQKNSNSYQCYNCHTIWSVSTARFVRPYRKTLNKIKTR